MKLTQEEYDSLMSFAKTGGPRQGTRAADGRPDCPFNGQCPVDDVDNKYPRMSDEEARQIWDRQAKKDAA